MHKLNHCISRISRKIEILLHDLSPSSSPLRDTPKIQERMNASSSTSSGNKNYQLKFTLVCKKIINL